MKMLLVVVVLVLMLNADGGGGVAVTRVRSQGYMTLTFNVVMKDLRTMGYEVTAGSASANDSAVPAAPVPAAILTPASPQPYT